MIDNSDRATDPRNKSEVYSYFMQHAQFVFITVCKV